ncbi:hypothetical protein KR044_006325 [Drosophila immigrans]|nr:hypothetical protein KR044_006325 [Drosophila immigrans]
MEHLCPLLIIFSVFIRGVHLTFARHTGDCSYAAGETFKQVCRYYITSDLKYRWMDNRVNVKDIYSVWQGEGEGGTVLVSFFDSNITRFDAITVVPRGHALKGLPKGESNPQGNYVKIRFAHSDVHCFKYNLRYVVNLLSNCMRKKYDENAVVPRGILHYSAVRSPTNSTSHLMSFPLNVFIIVFVGYIHCM